jgi:peptidase A4-like protein
MSEQRNHADKEATMQFEAFFAEVARRAHTFPLPPAEFDPLSATDSELERHGLPPRPDARAEPALFMFWERICGPPFRVVSPEFPREASPRALPFLLFRHSAGRRKQISSRGRRENSRNWSGAYVTPPHPNRFVSVTGAWKVPKPSVPTVLPEGAVPDNDEYRSSTWIGIDGHRSYPRSSLPQIGTSQFVSIVGGKTTVTMGAWWQWWVKDENFPPVEILNFPVAFDDEILASLYVQSADEVILNLKNQTTGLFTTFLVVAPGPIVPLGSTAEWIMERPTQLHSTRMYPMPHCTDVEFSHCLAKSAPAIGGNTTSQNLDNARLIRMYEVFPNPHRIAFVSQPEKRSNTTARVFYREAGG